MGLTRVKPILGALSVSCSVCYRYSPQSSMTKVICNVTKQIKHVCPTVGGFAGSCEAQFYQSDNKEIIQAFKKLSW